MFSGARAVLAAEGDAAASEPAPARFGERGQVALDNLVGLTVGGGYLGPNMSAGVAYDNTWGATGYTGAIGFTRSDIRGGMPGTASTYSARSSTAWISPSVDVFVADRISVGATVGFSYSAGEYDVGGDDVGTAPDGHAYAISAVPRVGYAIALNEPLTVWPRAGLGYAGLRADYAGHYAMNAWIGVVDLGLVYRPTKHVFLHVAPELVLRLARQKGESGVFQDNRAINLGFTGGLGILLNS
ncbi:hypothetical protein [Sorangium sp. So ce131]|uniref:hypothetical protein n=1 Tax=Sorangium sp. So ce131 TaxID=3133282 RepID=UPI003F5FAB67